MNITCVSLNLWEGGLRFPEVISFLKQANADILCLQEVYDGTESTLDDRHRTMQVLRATFPDYYYDYAPAFLYEGPEGVVPQGNAIMSRYPIEQSAALHLVKPAKETYEHIVENYPLFPRVLQRALIASPVGPVAVLNVHGVWDLDGDNDSEARKSMVASILEQAKDLPRTIIAGDTNAKSTNPAMLQLQPTFDSVFQDELVTTFNMRRKSNPGYATAAVDHMYVSHDVKVLEKRCPDVDISDHLPLVVKLEIS